VPTPFTERAQQGEDAEADRQAGHDQVGAESVVAGPLFTLALAGASLLEAGAACGLDPAGQEDNRKNRQHAG
jgi:hypothetical protein